MAIKTSYFFLLGLVFFIASCKKEVVQDPIPDEVPVFKADGTIGSESFSIAAGQNNFYMNTISEVIHGVHYYSGTLGNSETQLELGIFDGNIDLPNINLKEEIPTNLVMAIPPGQVLATLSKYQMPNSMYIQEIQWYIDNVFAGTNEVQITTPGKFNVCAVVTFTDGSNASICNEMIFGFGRHATGQIRQFLDQTGNLQVWVDCEESLISSVKWYMDGQLISNNLKLYTTVNDQNHVVTAEIVFTNNAKRKRTILVDGSLDGNFIDDFSGFENVPGTFLWDFTTNVGLKIGGKHYVSATPNQLATIHIVDVSYYGTNAAGKPVAKIIAEINCMLKDEITNQIKPFSCTTTFGVEIN